jgi:hypothetical protein
VSEIRESESPPGRFLSTESTDFVSRPTWRKRKNSKREEREKEAKAQAPFIKRVLSITQVRPPAKHEAYINIENVVASATVNQNLDLNAIVRIFPGVEYRPEQFPGLVYRLKKPKTATLIFNSGKMVCTGAKSEKQARMAVVKVVDELKSGGIVILAKPEIQIQNIVSSAGLGGHIDLESN